MPRKDATVCDAGHDLTGSNRIVRVKTVYECAECCKVSQRKRYYAKRAEAIRTLVKEVARPARLRNVLNIDIATLRKLEEEAERLALSGGRKRPKLVVELGGGVEQKPGATTAEPAPRPGATADHPLVIHPGDGL